MCTRRQSLRNAVGTVNFTDLAPLVRKLNAGQRIVVMAFGSSITCDHGGRFQSRPDSISSIVPAHFYQKTGKDEGWLRMFMTLINTTWPHPGKQVRRT